MTAPHARKPARRPISCPACKTRQPFTHTCTSCGFDIKAHALRVMRERATRKSQSEAPAGKPQTITVSASARRKNVVCPSCSTRQPFTHTCASCGFDIKGYVLRLRLKEAPADAPSTKDISQTETRITPTSSITSLPDQTIPPELFAEAEREILNLFMKESPEISEELPAPERVPVPSVPEPETITASQEEKTLTNPDILERTPVFEAALESSDQEALVAQVVEDVFEERPTVSPDTARLEDQHTDIENSFSEDALTKALDELDDTVVTEPEPLPEDPEKLQETALLPEVTPDMPSEQAVEANSILEESDQQAYPVADVPVEATKESEPLSEKEAAETDEVTVESFDPESDKAPKLYNEPEPMSVVEYEGIDLPADKDKPDQEPEEEPAIQKVAAEDDSTPLQDKQHRDEHPELIGDEPDAPAPAPEPEPIPANIEDEEQPVTETEEPVSDEQPQPELEEEPVLQAAKSAVDDFPTLEECPVLNENNTPHPVETTNDITFEREEAAVPEIAADNMGSPLSVDERDMPGQSEPLPDALPGPRIKGKEPNRTRRPAVVARKQTRRPVRAVRKLTPPTPPPPLYPEQQTPGPAELLSLGALARIAWEHYTKRASLLTTLWLIALAGAVAPFSTAIGLGFLVSWIAPELALPVKTLFVIAGLSAGLFGMSPGLGALVAAVADPAADQKVALYRGRHLWRSTSIILLMTAGTALGGGTLLIVPGLLAILGLGPALYIMFIEQETGLMAFIKSFEYLKGRAADSMLKLMPAAALCIILIVLTQTVPVLGLPMLLAFLLAVPYLLVYLHRMFENLRGMKGRIIIFQVSRHVRMRWTTAAVAGAAVPLLLGILLWRMGQAGNAFHLLASLI